MTETEASVRADADPDCTICGGHGWHWGWTMTTSGAKGKRIYTGDPVMLRCPCVDRNRQSCRSPIDRLPGRA